MPMDLSFSQAQNYFKLGVPLVTKVNGTVFADSSGQTVEAPLPPDLPFTVIGPLSKSERPPIYYSFNYETPPNGGSSTISGTAAMPARDFEGLKFQDVDEFCSEHQQK